MKLSIKNRMPIPRIGLWIAFFFALGSIAVGQVRAAEDEYAAIRETLETCFTCHGPNGASTEAEFPILAGQHFFYLYVQMKDFKAGRRASAVMEEFVATLDRDEMKTLARFFSEQAWPNIGYKSDPARAKMAKAATTGGQCVQCHLGGYEGNSGTPRVAGQHVAYLEKTMLDFKTKARANAAAKSSLMGSYSADEIRKMAEFMAGL
jgi:cytochrome c553